MSFLHVHFSDVDTQISQFARAIALPIRVFILRAIALNGNCLNKEAFYTTAFNAKTVNKHILELRALGIVKVKTVKTQVNYYIDEKLFGEMSANFSLFFGQELMAPIAAEEIRGHVPQTGNTPLTEYPHFGAYIKTQRLELNLSQAKLSEKVGIDRAFLSRIESGKKPFNTDKLTVLAKALYESEEKVKQMFVNFEPVLTR